MKYFSDGGSLPQGKSAPSFSPRAARSHSASVGSRNSLSVFSLSHSTICRRVVPTDADHRLVFVGEHRVAPKRRQDSLCLFEKLLVLSIRDRKSGDTEAVEPHSMAGPFVFLFSLAPH